MAGKSSGHYSTNMYTNAARMPLFVATDKGIRNREFISTATRSCGRLRGASRPRSTKKVSLCLLICGILDATFREFTFYALW